MTRPQRTRGCTRRRQLLRGRGSELSDSELIAALLGTAPDAAEPRPQQWLRQAGGLARLLSADLLCRPGFPGLGAARRARLLAAVELGRRYLEAPAVPGTALGSPRDAAACFKARLVDLPHEVFGCVFLDARHRVLCYESLFRGTIDGTTVHPREVVKRALQHNAAAVICGHNHPSGSCEPSQADRNITERLRQSLALVDIRLLDHLVVARDGCESLAERGWL